ncbi:MAG TPA: polysaccharide deacetylase family protein, partial [Candidatus Sulfotelmatobacter sp.]|nr:polysaccharide deacetylase family protein [Candidatus Sulfotelmatobacter sp.]
EPASGGFMRLRTNISAILLLLSSPILTAAQGNPAPSSPAKTIAERLGYPRDAKLLIIHADDLAVAHSEDAASFDALDKHAVTSASVMVPCAWLTEVAEYAKAHPDADLGLHLTLTSEWKTDRWGPVASKDTVPSLIAPDGYLWPETEPAAQHIKAEDAEREIRAQVERAIAMGIHPTHLDSHMGVLFSRPDLFAAYVKVAHEYNLPFLAVRTPDTSSAMLSQLSDKDIVLDALEIANPNVRPSDWKAFYLTTIKNLKPGVTEIIVHLGHDDAELQAITVDHPDYGAAWRQRDFDAITSPEFKQALQQNHIVLIGWKDLMKLLD